MTDVRLVPLRLLWASLPLTLGPLLAAALDPRATGFRTTVSLASWAVWALALVATLVPRVQTLTVVRLVVPAAVPAAIWAAAAHELDGRAAAGLAAAVAVAVAALAAPTGDAFVDGSSYGDERRFALRPPAPLLLGPIQLVWVAAVGGATAGPLLLAATQWLVGAIAVAVGAPIAVVAVRALHQLTRRWLVFVPAGFVLHDHLVLAEPVLFPRSSVAMLRLAPADTTATDLTAGAAGVALEAELVQPLSIVPAARRRALEPTDVVRFLFTPSRPGAALAEAARRRIAVDVPGR